MLHVVWSCVNARCGGRIANPAWTTPRSEYNLKIISSPEGFLESKRSAAGITIQRRIV